MNYNTTRVSKIRWIVPLLALASGTARPGAAQVPSAPEFAVASVRSNRAGNAGGEGSEKEKITVTPTSLTMWNVTLRSSLLWAYDMRDYQVAGPGWLSSERYDIAAKTSEAAALQQMRLMLQKLLAERFLMSVRYEAKELPVYMMSVKRRDKLKPSVGVGPGAMLPTGGAIEFRNYSMSELADRLATRPFKVDRVVLDRTGLEGAFDFKVEFAADLSGLKHALEGIELASPGAPSMLPILQEQLGLVFKAQKAPVDCVIVDHAERVPSGN